MFISQEEATILINLIDQTPVADGDDAAFIQGFRSKLDSQKDNLRVRLSRLDYSRAEDVLRNSKPIATTAETANAELSETPAANEVQEEQFASDVSSDTVPAVAPTQQAVEEAAQVVKQEGEKASANPAPANIVAEEETFVDTGSSASVATATQEESEPAPVQPRPAKAPRRKIGSPMSALSRENNPLKRKPFTRR